MPKQAIPPNPSIGIVLATYAAAPYIHLSLECARRYNPDARVLVHDDCSPRAGELAKLAGEYGADFVTTTSRRNPTVGDLSGFTEGLKWGRAKGIDVVLKCSRRYVIAKAWTQSLREAFNADYPTVCAPCAWYGFGFRSELVAMHVNSWIDSGALDRLAGYVARNEQIDPLPEAGIHREARKVFEYVHRGGAAFLDGNYVHLPDADMTLRSEAFYSRPENYGFYGVWPLMGNSRHQILPRIVWHDQDGHEQRAADLATEFGLPYTAASFANPNQ
jgi:hypothetical protein